jgi:hypothetical protein
MHKLEEFKLGLKAKDIISGAVGTLVSRVDWNDGNIQFGLHPENEIDPDTGYCQDWQLLDILEDACSDRVTPPQENPFNLNDKAEDLDNGSKGTIVRFHTYFNGCVHAVIERMTADGKILDHRCSINRLKLVKPAPVPKVKTGTGGPAVRFPAKTRP